MVDKTVATPNKDAGGRLKEDEKGYLYEGWVRKKKHQGGTIGFSGASAPCSMRLAAGS